MKTNKLSLVLLTLFVTAVVVAAEDRIIIHHSSGAMDQYNLVDVDSITFTQSPEMRIDSTFEVGGVDFPMVKIPSGSFMMGAQENETGAEDWEYPQHEVTIDYDFWMSKYEITQAQWEAIMDDNPSQFEGDSNPVEQVSWNDVQVFIDSINAIAGENLWRLPSESEWEYACRAGNDSCRFPWGDDEDYERLVDYAWYGQDETQPVGQKLPNAWGLYDMHGNVKEWCQDNGRADYRDTPRDGSAYIDEDMPNRITRGGFYSNSGDARSYQRCAWRGADRPEGAGSNNGFRLVRDID